VRLKYEEDMYAEARKLILGLTKALPAMPSDSCFYWRCWPGLQRSPGSCNRPREQLLRRPALRAPYCNVSAASANIDTDIEVC